MTRPSSIPSACVARPRLRRAPKRASGALLLLTWGSLLSCIIGCGNVLYLSSIRQAEKSLAQAEQEGAPQLAPYEYYRAQAQIEEAKLQAAQAEYGRAEQLAHTARNWAQQAELKGRQAQGGRAPSSQEQP